MRHSTPSSARRVRHVRVSLSWLGQAAGPLVRRGRGRRLRAYRKERDESRGVWKDRPRHDDASHGVDAFLTFACSNYTPPSALPARKRNFGWLV